VRLGFRGGDPCGSEILVVDEVLAVGDEAFANRCLDTIRELSAPRPDDLLRLARSLSGGRPCDRVLYLKDGKVRGLGTRGDAGPTGSTWPRRKGTGSRPFTPRTRSRQALEIAAEAPARPETPPATTPPDAESVAPPAEKPRRWGDGSVVITACRLLGESGEERYAFRTGETLVVEIEAHPRKRLTDFVFGVGLFTTEDVCLHGSNTDVDELSGESFEAPARVRVALSGLRLGEGTYLLDVAVHAKRGTPYDYWRGACRFRVSTDRPEAGLLSPIRRWESSGGVVFRPR
jgi:hypothetical protein